VERLGGTLTTKDVAFLARYLTATSRVDLCRILASADSHLRLGISAAMKRGPGSLREHVQRGGCVTISARNEEQLLLRPDETETALPETTIREILRSAPLRQKIVGGQSYRLRHHRKTIGIAESSRKTT